MATTPWPGRRSSRVDRSRTAAIGASVIAAHRELVTELLKLAGNDSLLAGLKPEEVGGLDGGLCKLDGAGAPARVMPPFSHGPGARSLRVEAEAPPPLELQHWSMHSLRRDVLRGAE